MNKHLLEFSRNWLITNLNLLPPHCNKTFKLMYGRLNGKRSVEDAILMPIEDVIMEIPEEKLDWAMQQVENSIQKIAGRN
jgi:hypothetical protein